MTDRRIILPGPDTITLSGQTADKLIRAGDGNAALLYLYVLRAGGGLSVGEAAAALSLTEHEISAATGLLGRLGLLKYDEPPSPPRRDEPPEYTAEDIKRELDNGSVFSSLVREVQKSLGKLMSSDDLVRLFGIYDSLGLPPDVILHLVTYCIDENKRRYGPGRSPTMRYIEKAAYTWEREGIGTLHEAERYIKQLDVRRGKLAEIKRVLQITDREFSPGERKYVEEWISMGFSPEVIERAYDITIVRTQKLSWSYMHTIISDWHRKGLFTPEDIAAKDGKSAAPRKQAAKKQAATPDEELADIERMKKYLKELREE